MKCYKCGLSITSKNDLVIGYLWALPFNGIIVSYYQKCFDAIHNQGLGEGIIPTASISLSKLGSQKLWHYLRLAFPTIFLSIGFFSLINQQGFSIWGIAGVLVFACLVFLFSDYQPHNHTQD